MKTEQERKESAAGENFRLFFSALIPPVEIRKELLVFTGISALVFFVLHWCYPFAYISADSYGYIFSASTGIYGGYRPMGYSWFLQFAHLFSTSLTFTIFLQFFLHTIAVLYFLFTIRRYFPPAKPWIFKVFALLLLLNVHLLFLVFWLMSDSIFVSLTLVAFASLLRLLENPSRRGALMLLLFTFYLAMQTRFAGLALFPVFVIALFMVHRFRKIFLHVILATAALAGVWLYNRIQNERTFSEPIFSAFGGWAKANNASILLPHVQIDTTDWSARATMAYRTIRSFDDSCFTEEKILATDFIWNRNGPGRAMIEQQLKMKKHDHYVNLWVHAGAVYDEYGNAIIRQHPVAYARYFLWPNAKRLLNPADRDDVSKFPKTEPAGICKDWFGIYAGEFTARYDPFATFVSKTGYYSYRFLLLIFLPVLACCFVMRQKLQWLPAEKNSLNAIALLVVFMCGFLVWSHPVMYRYVGWLRVFLWTPVYALVNAWLRRRSSQAGSVA